MKSLILYYSYRGNTQRIAERIHSAIGGDIARIDTVVPYTGSYDDVVAQGEREVKRGFLPELKAMDIDLDRYDTIVLGTPVWWYTCAPATRAFLTAHDLSGKTVYPFATNGGWLGRTLKDVAALCPGARRHRRLAGGPALPLRRHAAGSHRLGQVPRQMTAAAQNRIPGRRKNRRPGIFANLYLIYTRFFVISLHFRLKYAIFSPSGSAGLRDISCRRCTTADHAAGKLSESERMTRYAARNTRRPVPARWRARLELGYGAQSHQSPIWHQLHDQRTAAVLSPPSAAKT